MKKTKDPTKALLFNLPLSLVEKVQHSAEQNQRSVVKEVVWRLQQSYVTSNDDGKVTVK